MEQSLSSENTVIKTLLTPKINLGKVKTEICTKVNSSKEKSKNKTVPYRFCPGAKHQKLGQFSKLYNYYSYDFVC
jgi:hypothetical protein